MKISLLLLLVLMIGCDPEVEKRTNLFNIGDIVAFKADTNRIGIVTQVYNDGRFYEVKWTVNNIINNNPFYIDNPYEFELMKR